MFYRSSKFLRSLILFLSLLTLGSCVTKALWGAKSYNERISKFLAGNDGRYIVLVGKDFHYIFTDNSGVLKSILNMKNGGNLEISQEDSYLNLKINNEIEGHLVFKGRYALINPEDAQSLRNAGVVPDTHGDITVDLFLTGRRYLAKYLNQNLSENETSNRVIKIYYRDSNVVKNVGKVAVTPVAVGVDAVLLIGKAVVGAFDL